MKPTIVNILFYTGLTLVGIYVFNEFNLLAVGLFLMVTSSVIHAAKKK